MPFLIPQKDAKYFSRVLLANKLKWLIKKYFLFKVAKFDQKYVNFPFFTETRKGLQRFVKTVVQFVKFTTSDDKSYGILTIPGELFEGIGKNLIREAPSLKERTFIFQNSQDWIGYLFPLETYITEGGYEPFMCYSPLCGAYIENGTKNFLRDIK